MGLANLRGGWSIVQAQWGHCSGDATCPTRMVQNSSAESIRANERGLRNCRRIKARSLEGVLGCLPPHPSCSAGVVSGCLAGMGTHLALEQNESGRRHRLALACLQGKRLLQLQMAHTSGSITRYYAQLPSYSSARKVGGA
jgi:hypothetical protein